MATPSLRWNSPRCKRRNRSRRISGSRHVLLDFLEDSVVVRRDFRIFRDPLVPNDPVGIQQEHGALRHALQTKRSEALVEHPVRRADGLVPIAEQRIVEAVLLLEDPMAVVAVRTDPEHLRAPLLKVSHRVAQRAELALAHVREVPDVERQDYGASAELFREGDRLSLVAQHREIRRLLADLHHPGPPPPPSRDPRGITLSLSTLREAALAAERNVYLTGGTHSGPRLSRGIAEPDQTHRLGIRGRGKEWRSTY